MKRVEVLKRLCDLQSEVQGALDYHASPSDCICRDPLPWMAAYTNEGKALVFIEQAVRAALAVRASPRLLLLGIASEGAYTTKIARIVG